jgi:signal recognition particle subunit SRP54
MRHLRGSGKLTEENIEEALKEVRTALLSADVHFKVVRSFIESVKAQAVGQEVVKSVSPGQMLVKIMEDELAKLLGEGDTAIAPKRPLTVLLVGLHGSGKTTSTAKLGRLLKKQGETPFTVACDVYRPAAIDQLETLARQESLGFYADRDQKKVPKIGRAGLKQAQAEKASVVLFDTAGRLQIDEDLIEEVRLLHKEVAPDEVLLVADAALGQEAVNVARTFHEALALTGIVLTKLDGDARGGAALSMKQVTGVPIKYAGTGEKAEDFEVFHPDRMASRILGMGDVVTLVEKAQEEIDQDEATRLAEKMRRADFNLEDFLSQLRQVKKLGPLGKVMGMMPGMNGIEVGDKEENKMKRTEAIIQSMTPRERQQPQLLNGSRRMRIANGSGVQVRDVNQLLKQFTQMRKMMKQMKGGKGRKLMKQMEAMQGAGGGGGNMPKLPPGLGRF